MDIGTLTGSIDIEDELSGKLELISHTVMHFVDDFDGAMGAVAAGVGIATTAILGMTASIIALGNKGSDINDVSATLEHFAGSAENATKIVEKMRAGVLGTVDDFVLAKEASKLLSANVKLTADQFGELTQAAFVLQNRGLGSTEEMMSLVSNAMITGRTRALAMKLGVVEVKDATAEFAKSLGTTKDRLSETGVAEARRIAIMKMLASAVKDAGVQERDFGEQMQAAVVVIQNWGDELASSVAKSTHVTDAVKAIASSITVTFAGVGDTISENLLAGIDKFADMVGQFAPRVISAIGDIVSAGLRLWNWLKDLNDRFDITGTILHGAQVAWQAFKDGVELARIAAQQLSQAWGAVPDWLQDLAKAALATGAGFAAIGLAANAIATPLSDMVRSFDTAVNIITNITASTQMMTHFLIGANAPIVGLMASFGNLTTTIKSFTVVQIASEIATKSVTVAQLLWGAAADATVAKLGLATIATRAYAFAQGLVAAAAAPLIPILLALQIRYSVLTTELAAATLGQRAFTIGSYLTTAAMGVLGTAILALQYVLIPLVAAWAAWKFGEWLGSFPLVQRGVLWLAEHMHLISKETADAKRATIDYMDTVKEFGPNMEKGFRSTDPAIRLIQDQMVKVGTELHKTGNDLDTFVENAVKRFTDLRDSGKTMAGNVIALDAQLSALGMSAGVPTKAFQDLADSARRVKAEGGTLTGTLEQLITKFPAIQAAAPSLGTPGKFLKDGSKEAEDFAKKLISLHQTLVTTYTDVAAFDKVYSGLTPKQLADPVIQQRLMPKIEETANANQGQLSSAMRSEYDLILNNQKALSNLAVEKLRVQNVTTSYINTLKEQGLTETQIAIQLGVMPKDLALYTAELDRASAHQKEQTDVRLADLKRMADAQNAGYKSIVSMDKQYTDFMRGQSMTRQDIQEVEITEWVQEQQDAFVGSEEQWEQYNRRVLQLADARRAALKIDNQALIDNSQGALQEVANKARNTYAKMAADPNHYSAVTRDRFRQIARDAQEAADGVTHAWRGVFEAIPDILQSAFEGGGGIAGAFKSLAVLIASEFGKELSTQIKRQLDELGKDYTGSALSKETMRLAAGIGLTAGIAAAASGASTKQQAGMGLSAGLNTGVSAYASGASLSTSIALGLTTAGISLAITGIVSFIKHLSAGRNAVKDFATSFGGFDTLRTEMNKLGDAGEQMWKQLTQGGMSKREVEAYGKQIQKALAEVEADVQKYGLSWDEVGSAQDQAAKSAEKLEASYKRLTNAGFSADKVIDSMSGDLNQYVINAVKAGVKIPQAMQPILESLIKQKKLSQEAANALLGIADAGMPALSDIKDAAARYGLTLDDLGPKVKQLSINEQAAQIAADFDTLMKATGGNAAIFIGHISAAEQAVIDLNKKGYDTAAIGTKEWEIYQDAVKHWKDEVAAGGDAAASMRSQVQSMINDALKAGLELPASMKPVIQAMIDAGLLTDQFGAALTDTTKLHFAADLSAMFDTLMTKLDALIDKITDGVGGALTGVGNTTVHPKIEPQYTAPNPDDSSDPNRNQTAYATGGPVYAATGYVSKGTDTVPAVLTPGEGIITTSGMQGIGAAGLAAINSGSVARVVGAALGQASAQTAQLTATLKALQDQQAQVARGSFTLIQGFKDQSTASDKLTDKMSDLRIKSQDVVELNDQFPDLKPWSDHLSGSVTAAGKQIQIFTTNGKKSVGEFSGSLDGVSGHADSAAESVKAIGTGASIVAGAFGGAFGSVQSSLKDSQTSSEDLRASVGKLPQTASDAASATVDAGTVMDQTYSNSTGIAEILRSKVGEIVDENGNVVASLDVQPWSEWAGKAGLYIEYMIGLLDTLVTRALDAAKQISSIPAPASGSTTPTGPTVPKPGPVIVSQPEPTPQPGPSRPGPISGPGTDPNRTPGPQRPGQFPGPGTYVMGAAPPPTQPNAAPVISPTFNFQGANFGGNTDVRAAGRMAASGFFDVVESGEGRTRLADLIQELNDSRNKLRKVG